MSLFTPHNREEIKTGLINMLTAIHEISAVILIGSGAKGLTDELSDLDIMSVVADEANDVTVIDKICECVKTRYTALCFVQLYERRLQVCLLDNFLELNFSYRTLETLEARAANWRVLFDRVGDVDATMHSTYAKFSESQDADRSITYQRKLTEYSEQIWHYIFHATAAIERGRYWKAVKEFEYIRNFVMELKGLRYSLEMGRNKDADKIPQVELDLLQKTLPSTLTKEALVDTLMHLITAAYNELEITPNSHISVSRVQAIEYVTQALGL